MPHPSGRTHPKGSALPKGDEWPKALGAYMTQTRMAFSTEEAPCGSAHCGRGSSSVLSGETKKEKVRVSF